MEVCTFALTFASEMPEPRKTELSTSPDTRSHWKPSWSGILLLLGPEGRVLANCNEWGIKAVHYFQHGEPKILECEQMLFGLYNALAMFQRLMQNCIGELNLTFCLIYLDDVIVFLKMKEEHLWHLGVVFNHFWEHNLRLKPTMCKFFWNDINHLAHHVSREGVQLSIENLKAVAEFALLWTYMEIQAFLGLVGHYQWFSKGFAHITQPLHEHLSGEGASKKSNQIMFMVESKDAFEKLKKACLEAPVLAFADINKVFLRCLQVRIRSCAIPKTDWWSTPSGSICKLISNYSWA